VPSPAVDYARCELPLGVHAVGAARQFIEDTLTEWDADSESRATARLLGSELVTNAVLYGYGARELRLRATGEHLRIMVADDAPIRPPLPEPIDDPDHVHGLQLVEAYSTSWGTDPAKVGKVVEYVESLQQKSAKEATEAALKEAVTTVKTAADALKGLPDKLIRGALYDQADSDPRFMQAYMGRHKNPESWGKVLNAFAQNLAKEVPSADNTRLASDQAALRAAVNGQTTAAPPPEKSVSNDQISSLRPTQFQRFKGLVARGLSTAEALSRVTQR